MFTVVAAHPWVIIAATIEERGRVLELIAGHGLAEHALGRDRRAVGGDHARDLARLADVLVARMLVSGKASA